MTLPDAAARRRCRPAGSTPPQAPTHDRRRTNAVRARGMGARLGQLARWCVPGLLLALAVLAATAAAAQTPSAGSQTNERVNYYFELAEPPTAGLPETDRKVVRSTPQATVETLLDLTRRGDFVAAAHTLNLSQIPKDKRAVRGPELARQLAEVIRVGQFVNWSRLPDRPDGLIDPTISSSGSPMVGVPRRSLTIANLELNDRDARVGIARYQLPDGEKLWLFDPATLRNVPELYKQGPESPLLRYIPYEWQQPSALGLKLWQWATIVLIVIASTILGTIVAFTLNRLLLMITRPSARQLIQGSRLPMTLAISLLAAWLGSDYFLNPRGAVGIVIARVSIVGLMIAATWLTGRVVEHAAVRVSRRFVVRAEGEDDAAARRLVTQLSIARRLLVLIAILVGVGITLSYFDIFRALGLSLLFSAGALSVILGLASTSFLQDFLAGIQIGIFQHVRIGDTVSVAERYGYVEEIGSVFLTMRTWDHRRLIVPYRVLLQHPIENWSQGSAFVVRTVEIVVDFHADLEQLRDVLKACVSSAPEADRIYEPSLIVAKSDSTGMTLWALVGAPTPAKAWALDYKVREELGHAIAAQRDAKPRSRLEQMEEQPSPEYRGAASEAKDEAQAPRDAQGPQEAPGQQSDADAPAGR
jgi:small-conductance mechanosensitive channel